MPIQISPTAQQVFWNVGTGLFPVVTRPGHTAHHPLLPSTKVGNGSELHLMSPHCACTGMSIEWNWPFPIIILSIYSNWYALPNLTVGLTPKCTVRKQDKTGVYSAGSSYVPFFWGQPPQDMLKYRHTPLLLLQSTHRLALPHSASLHKDLQNIKQHMSKHMQVPAYICSRCH